MTLQGAIHLTVWGHEWYWQQVWEEKSGNSLPHLYLLHSFYRHYQEQLVGSFENYQTWEKVIRHLGCPVTWSRTLEFSSWSDRCGKVRKCFTEQETKPRRRKYRHWQVGGKWQRQWEATPEEILLKKEAREKKQEWRDQLGKDRDRRKSRWRRSPGHFYKRARSQTHRSWVRSQLHRENWEVFSPKEREIFFDPYIWS